MNNVEQFRPRNGYFLSFWAFFTISTLTYVNVLDYGFLGGLPSITWGLFASSFFYLIFIHPKVIYCDEGLVIVNPMRRITLGWHEISQIDSKFTMFVMHQPTGIKFHSFAAQAPGRYHIRNVHPSEIRGMKLNDSGSIKAGESPRSNSGIAIAIARTRFENFHQRGDLVGLNFSSEFNRPGAVILCSLFLLAIITQLIQA
ncbi:hypothetical protein LBMAG10_16810 [Actinomycetes bacterium]|nr:hypothetical protein EMGBS5_06080 [Clavibacter sp.]GDX25016.1 hypothetical protein LBMAG10_16810 [Actinomycetes bacterium]